MALHGQARAFLDDIEGSGVTLPWECPTAPEARLCQQRLWTPPPERIEVGRTWDRSIPGPAGEIAIRVYHPPTGATPFPALLWFHGGGWILGTLDLTDDTCRALCVESGAAVVSVDYRLAPENPFPAGLEDAIAAVAWVAAHGRELGIDGERLAVGGDSSGGNLAAAAAQFFRAAGAPRVAFQLLVYPVTGTPWDERGSQSEFAVGYYLTLDAMRWFTELYSSSPADRRDPRLAPILSPDLGGLPAALVITAGCDVLRDEGEEYAQRMLAAGVDAKLTRYDGQLHSFFGVPARFDAGTAAREEAGAALRDSLRVA